MMLRNSDRFLRADAFMLNPCSKFLLDCGLDFGSMLLELVLGDECIISFNNHFLFP